MSEEQVSVTTDVVSDNYLLCELRSGLADFVLAVSYQTLMWPPT